MRFFKWLFGRLAGSPLASDVESKASSEANAVQGLILGPVYKNDFSATNEALAKVWCEVGAVASTVKAGTILYSGLRSGYPACDVAALVAKQGNLWLSQSAFYAGDYCYRDSENTAARFLIKVRLSKDIEVLRFPKSFNPADAFFRYERSGDLFTINYSETLRLRYEGSQPDHHVVKNLKEILGFQVFWGGLVGHVRYAMNENLGATPQEIIELFTMDLDSVEILEWVTPPETKPEFHSLVGMPRSLAASKLFAE